MVMSRGWGRARHVILTLPLPKVSTGLLSFEDKDQGARGGKEWFSQAEKLGMGLLVCVCV